VEEARSEFAKKLNSVPLTYSTMWETILWSDENEIYSVLLKIQSNLCGIK